VPLFLRSLGSVAQCRDAASVSHNDIGKAGGLTADLLFQTLGLASFLLVIPAALLGFGSFAGLAKTGVLQSALGYMAIILCVAAALEMFRYSPPYEANFSGAHLVEFISDLLWSISFKDR